jgi:hypothetical protein
MRGPANPLEETVGRFIPSALRAEDDPVYAKVYRGRKDAKTPGEERRLSEILHEYVQDDSIVN